MREILFRGKRLSDNAWIEGFYDVDASNGKEYIHVQHYAPPTWSDPGGECFSEYFEIIPKTLGQYTGTTDKNGAKIFEGDTTSNGYVIMWSDKKALFCEHFESKFDSKWSEASYPMQAEGIEIVGNIHENKEQC